MYYQIYGANVEPRKVIWPAVRGADVGGQYARPYTPGAHPPFLELEGTATPPAWVLPPGWQASRFNVLPGGGQLEYLLRDTLLANAYYQPEHEDRAAVWPAAYQNQATFKPYYHRLRRETRAMLETPAWRAAEAVTRSMARSGGGGAGADPLSFNPGSVPAQQLRSAAALARGLTLSEITSLVRIASDPVILESNGRDVSPQELAHIVDTLRILFKLRVSTPAGAEGSCPAAEKADADAGKGGPAILVIVGLRSGFYVEGGLEHEPFWATKKRLTALLANKDKGEGAPETLHCPMLGPLFGERYRVLEDIDWTETVALAEAAHAKAGLPGEPVTGYPDDDDASWPDTCSARGSKGHFITQELAQAAFMSYFFPDSRVEILDSCNELHKMVEPGYLDGFDLVVNYHSPYHALQLSGTEADWKAVGAPGFEPIGPDKYLAALENADAVSYPSPFFNLNGDKSRVYRVLNQTGQPHLPFEWYQVPTSAEGPVEPLAAAVIADLVKNDWGCALLKPSFASFSIKLHKLCVSKTSSAAEKRARRANLVAYLTHIRTGIPAGWHAEFSALYFVDSVGRNMQLRMYYHGGKLAHFIGEQVNDNCEHDPKNPTKICDGYAEWSWATPITGGGTINTSSLPLAKVIEIAERSSAALQAAAPANEKLPPGWDNAVLPAARVDLTCCLKPSDPGYEEGTGGWFINELEPMHGCTLQTRANRELVQIYGHSAEFWASLPMSPRDMAPLESPMDREFRRARAAWNPTIPMIAMEMAKLAHLARTQKICRRANIAAGPSRSKGSAHEVHQQLG